MPDTPGPIDKAGSYWQGEGRCVVAQILDFFLGGISAGIQALRLNYVEFFSKFYHGNGVPFKPFGAATVETA